jgi:hypothetical protein
MPKPRFEPNATPYEKWNATFCHASEHLLLSALLRDYFDEVDNLIVRHENLELTFQEEMKKLYDDLHDKLKLNKIDYLYKLRQEKNEYIMNLKKQIIQSP